MNYYIITFGCQMNKSDSERIAAVLENVGYQKAAKMEEADLIVVNMCSVRQSAVDRVYGLIAKFKKLKSYNSNLTTILTGCILKKDLEKFKKSFDYILSIRTLPKWKDFLKFSQYFYYPDPRDEEFNKKWQIKYLKIKPKYNSTFRAFVPISWGCNNFCTFCAVPYTRGLEISRPTQDIIQEAKRAVKEGAREIWLLGQNVNSYKFKNQNAKCKMTNQNTKLINFAKLLKMVNDIEGEFWIRFTSPHPKDFSDELIKTMAICKKVTPYLNLPVQSGDDEILKRMNRPYTVSQYKNLVKKIRKAFKKYRKGLEKEIALSTDIIVGFPGETKKQFENTAKLFKEIKFDMAYIAQFSPRPGTPATKMEDNISKAEKKSREKTLTEILEKTVLERNKKFVGKKVLILPEIFKNGFLIGKSRHYKTVKFKGEKNLIGKFVKVKIVKAISFGLEGKIQAK